MTHKTSTAADARLNLGEMRYGEGSAGPHALTFADGTTYSYDANGNRINKADTTYSWDYRNQLTSVEDGTTTSTYQYDTNGQRVRQTVTNNGLMTTTLYIGQYAEVRGDQLIQYIFADDGRIAQMSSAFDAEGLSLLKGLRMNPVVVVMALVVSHVVTISIVLPNPERLKPSLQAGICLIIWAARASWWTKTAKLRRKWLTIRME